MKKLIYFLTMGLFVLLVQNASAQMPPMGSHGGPPGMPPMGSHGGPPGMPPMGNH